MQSVLQIVAIISMLVGAIMASTAVVMMVGTSRLIADMPSNISMDLTPMTQMGYLGIVGAAMPVFWGIALLKAAPAIAIRLDGN
ncbi:MAG: hypothetical protein GY930_02660 [bacterium]|nr:hypothetical protein [bacterium]